MGKIKVKAAPGHIRDCERIVEVGKNAGYLLTLGQAEDVWLAHSRSYAAGWLWVPDDDSKTLEIIERYTEIEE